ncbi:UPF0764 protein C16orf89 homolog [Amyelois transitella]|uniref:UPF0764 protein C16orf89 homolog n=1 Tax=Amyelois transitella TaxID=680683 RepID=UPI00299077C9|nr:UPF0764 protein C16orf89 homolog [Amyelois transitella]
MCLAKISRNPINTSPRTHSVKCDLPEDCHQSVLYGTDHGYALTHRLLFLQVARYARRCHVVSELEDTKLRNKFCSLCYRECLYISMNEFQDIDLFLEHIYFCSLEGHSQFIRRRWLAKIIKSQTREGCFPDSLDYKKNIRSGRIGDDDGTKINKRFSILGGRCNAHTTSLAAGVLAAAVRFILETFY